MRLFKAAIVAPALAQGWSARTSLFEGWFVGDAISEGGPIRFRCAGGYAGADPMVGEGISNLAPYVIRIVIDETIGEVSSSSGPRNEVIFVIGNTGYLLPDVFGDEMLHQWTSEISVGDPLVTALLAGGDAQLWSGQVLVGDLPGAGLAASMADAINFCDRNWVATGVPLPSHAAETIQILRAQPAPPASMEQVMLDEITRHCGGNGQVRADTIGRSDFDGDGVEDILLHWSGVTCQSDNPMLSGRGGGECGILNCLTTAYVSSSIRAGNEPFRILAASAWVDPAISTDILLGVGLNDCEAQNLQPNCQTRSRWTGAEFTRIE